jgi:hypothetical protein
MLTLYLPPKLKQMMLLVSALKFAWIKLGANGAQLLRIIAPTVQCTFTVLEKKIEGINREKIYLIVAFVQSYLLATLWGDRAVQNSKFPS